MAAELTSNLRLELDKCSLQFNRWAASKKEWLVSNDSNYNDKLEECNVTIHALQENDSQLENSRHINDAIKMKQRQEIEQSMEENQLLLKQKNMLENQLTRFSEDEERESKMLEDARIQHETLRNKMEQALNDLIYGMRHYTYLGLEFQKAEGDHIKFIFTQIVETDPSRKFYFVMFVNAQNQYQLVETNPTLDRNLCKSCIDNLNNSNDIGRFIVSMRKLFKATLQ